MPGSATRTGRRSPSSCGRDEAARLGFVRDVPAKIDFSRDQLAVANGVDLAVPEPLAGFGRGFIDDQGLAMVRNGQDKIERNKLDAVRPAALKKGCAIECVVQGAGEVI